MGNKNIDSKKEFNIKILGELNNGRNSLLIKTITNANFIDNIKIFTKENNTKITFRKNVINYQLNIIDNNKNNKKSKIDCIIMEYDINNQNSFEGIKELWHKKVKDITQEVDCIYLIGIKNEKEERTKDEAMKFCDKNNINFISLSNGDKNDIINLLNNILETLKTKNENNIDNKQEKNKNKKLPGKTNFKVVFLGTYGSGTKTSLISRIINDKFELNTCVTNGCSYCSKVIELINGKKIVLDIWDTSFNVIRIPSPKIILENTDCIVLGFEVISDESFKEIKDVWYPYAKENTDTDLIYLIGNKIDLIK